MRLIDADALREDMWEPESILVVDAAPTVRCGECRECDTCDIHDHAILDVPNFACAYFERRDHD